MLIILSWHAVHIIFDCLHTQEAMLIRLQTQVASIPSPSFVALMPPPFCLRSFFFPFLVLYSLSASWMFSLMRGFVCTRGKACIEKGVALGNMKTFLFKMSLSLWRLDLCFTDEHHLPLVKILVSAGKTPWNISMMVFTLMTA